MTSLLRLAMISALLALLAGCGRVPAINAKLVRYESSYPIGGTSITIEGVEVTDTEVKAASYERTTKLWGFTQSVQIEGYRRERTPADKLPEAARPPSVLAP